ncbi:hypothetical protein M2D63_025650, partial [Pseudomonas sp. BJa5]|nr:hypothetical protein [Pseudomonas sp. BGr12]
MNRYYALFLSVALLQRCHILAPESTASQAPALDPAQKQADKPVVYGSFRQDTVYNLLTAELAGQRDRFDIALDTYVSEAIKTQDPGI